MLNGTAGESATSLNADVITREADHRVANSLAMLATFLRMSARRVKDSDARDTLRAAEARLRAVSVFHSYMLRRTTSTGRIDLLRYLEGALAPMGDATGVACRLRSRPDYPIEVSRDTAMRVIVVVNELILNAGKHAYNGRSDGAVTIDVGRTDDQVWIGVSDEGPGFPAAFDPERQTGTGFRIVTAILSQMDGSIAHHSKNGGTIVISFSEA